jgi:hypothetical protein
VRPETLTKATMSASDVDVVKFVCLELYQTDHGRAMLGRATKEKLRFFRDHLAIGSDVTG